MSPVGARACAAVMSCQGKTVAYHARRTTSRPAAPAACSAAADRFAKTARRPAANPITVRPTENESRSTRFIPSISTMRRGGQIRPGARRIARRASDRAEARAHRRRPTSMNKPRVPQARIRFALLGKSTTSGRASQPVPAPGSALHARSKCSGNYMKNTARIASRFCRVRAALWRRERRAAHAPRMKPVPPQKRRRHAARRDMASPFLVRFITPCHASPHHASPHRAARIAGARCERNPSRPIDRRATLFAAPPSPPAAADAHAAAGQNTSARTSMLRRGAAAARVVGSSNAVCAVRRARPSSSES